MIKYAITGNIASGKTEVQKILERNGFRVFDTDHAGHVLLENNSDVIKAFKDFDILQDGKISRDKLGKVVFNNKEKLEKLNSILHPEITKKILEFFEENKSEKKVFVGIPLLFETKMEKLFDKVILVYTDDDIRLKRLLARNNYTIEYAQKRISCQDSQDEKIKKSDIIIYNNGTLKDLEEQLSGF